MLFIMNCITEKIQAQIISDSIDWLPKRGDVKKGTILVPENHDIPNGKQIKIAYVLLKAKDTTSTSYPLIFFSGGPGGNAINIGLINYLLDHPLTKERDVILFDQRGIGYSSALPDMSPGAFDILAKDANENEELALMTTLINNYRKKCADLDISPQYYNTIQNAKDVGLLFKHLNYEKYNLFGGSYGTRIARVVQDMFPEYIHSSVLDSPALLSGDFLLDRLNNYSVALERILDYCNETAECNKKYPQLQDDYFKAISGLNQKPLMVSMNDSLDVYVNAQDGVYLLRRILYQNNSREKAPELIKAFIDRNEQVIKETLQFELEISGMLNLSMLLSVEKYENFNPENSSQLIDEHYQNYPLLPVKLGFFDAFYQAGMNWHENSLPLADRKFKDSDIPTLIFVNQYDPVTPPENGYLFLENLSNGTLLVLDEGGHASGNPECKDQVIIDFINNPNRDPKTACLKLYKK